MTTFAPRTQQPAAAGHGAPRAIPATSTAAAAAPSSIHVPVATPARARLITLLGGLRRRTPVDPAHDAGYRHDDGGAGDDGGWD